MDGSSGGPGSSRLLPGQRTSSTQVDTSTRTARWNGPGLNIRSSLGLPPSHDHRHTAEQILSPLKTVTSARGLVQAIRDIVECILATHRVEWPCSDVSASNIVLDKGGRGTLIDWDHAVNGQTESNLEIPAHSRVGTRQFLSTRLVHDSSQPHGVLDDLVECYYWDHGIKRQLVRVPAFSRTGTWEFLSILRAQNLATAHDVFDDLESCYWVLLHTAIHFLMSNATRFKLHMFDECEIEGDTMVGGSKKFMYMRMPDKHVLFKCQPFQELQTDLSQLLSKFYGFYAERRYDEESYKLIRQFMLEGSQNLSDADRRLVRGCWSYLECFERALASPVWDNAKVLPDQFPHLKKIEDSRQDDKIMRALAVKFTLTSASLQNSSNAPLSGPSMSLGEPFYLPVATPSSQQDEPGSSPLPSLSSDSDAQDDQPPIPPSPTHNTRASKDKKKRTADWESREEMGTEGSSKRIRTLSGPRAAQHSDESSGAEVAEETRKKVKGKGKGKGKGKEVEVEGTESKAKGKSTSRTTTQRPTRNMPTRNQSKSQTK